MESNEVFNNEIISFSVILSFFSIKGLFKYMAITLGSSIILIDIRKFLLSLVLILTSL